MADEYYNSSLSGAQIEAVLAGVNGITGVVKRKADGTFEAASLYPVLTGSSAPTTSTEGSVNQIYRTATDLYICTAVNNTVYTWTKYTRDIAEIYAISYNISQSLTDGQKDLALSNISASRSVLSGSSDPTTATVGKVNQFYRNTTSNILFICTGVDSSTYTWVRVNEDLSLNAVSYTAVQSLSEAQKEIALGNISASRNVLTGSADPTTSTVGIVNQLYRNTTSNVVFICTSVADSVYTWIKVTGGEVSSVNGKTGAVVLSASDIACNGYDNINNALSNKLNAYPGSSYSGCVLMVNSQGAIVPQEFPTWSGGSY